MSTIGTVYNSQYGYTSVGCAEGGELFASEGVELSGAALRPLLKPKA